MVQHPLLLESDKFDVCFVSSGVASVAFQGGKVGDDFKIDLPQLVQLGPPLVPMNASNLQSLEEEQPKTSNEPIHTANHVLSNATE